MTTGKELIATKATLQILLSKITDNEYLEINGELFHEKEWFCNKNKMHKWIATELKGCLVNRIRQMVNKLDEQMVEKLDEALIDEQKR